MSFLNHGKTCNIDHDSSSSCKDLYLFWLAIFACVAVPITCLEFTEVPQYRGAVPMLKHHCLALLSKLACKSLWLYSASWR